MNKRRRFKAKRRRAERKHKDRLIRAANHAIQSLSTLSTHLTRPARQA